MARPETVTAATLPPAAEPPTLVSPVADESLAADEPLVPHDTAAISETPADGEPLVPDDTAAISETPADGEPLVPDDTAAISETPAADEPTGEAAAAGVLPPDDVPPDGPLTGVPVMAAPHAGLEVAAPAERAASQPAA